LTAHSGVIVGGFPTVLIEGQPAARVSDMHTCPMVMGGFPHCGGPIMITPCVSIVLVGSMRQASMGDMAICVGSLDVIVLGARTVLVGTSGGAGGGGGGGGGGLSGVIGGVAGAVMAAISPPYPRAVLQPDGTTATEYAPGIVIKGDAEFQAQTVAALDKIAETPSGSKMLDDFSKTGKTVTIVKTTGGNGVSGFSGDAKRNSDGTRGDGSDSTLKYNPDTTSIGSEEWETRPPEVGLAHEMVHATHVARGDISTDPVQNDNKPDPANPGSPATEIDEEVRTVGIPPYDNEPYSENTIRSEWDPPQPERKWY